MIKHKRPVCWEKLLLIAFMLLPTLTISLNLDNDFWFLLNHGRFISENGFPSVEPFTVHADLQFLIQQWLFCAVIHFLYSAFGKIGVLCLVYICALVCLFLIYKLCMLLSGEKFYLSVIIATVCYLILCLWYMVSRPQIFTYIIVLLELHCLENYAKGGKWKSLLLLPILSVLLINAHAAMWWLLFAFLLPYMVEAMNSKGISRDRAHYSIFPLLITAVLTIGAGFLNPYGIRSILYVIRSFGDETINSSIMEMSSPDVKGLNGAIFFAVVLLVVACYAGNRKGQFRLRYILLSLGTTFMALLSIKSISYFAIGTLIPLACYLSNLADRLVFETGNRHKVTKATAGFLALILCAAVYVVWDGYQEEKDYPATKAAVEYLVENENVSEVTLYTSFYDGGYAQYRGLKTYIDPRAEVFIKAVNQKEDIFLEYMTLQEGRLHYKEFLDKYSFTHILVGEDDVLEVYLSKDIDYMVYYKDSDSKIYIPITE